MLSTEGVSPGMLADSWGGREVVRVLGLHDVRPAAEWKLGLWGEGVVPVFSPQFSHADQPGDL